MEKWLPEHSGATFSYPEPVLEVSFESGHSFIGSTMGRLTAPLLGQLLPAFAAELEAALLRDQEATLAAQIINLPIKGPCLCGDPSCSGFFTAQRPQTLWRTGRKVVTPAMSQGMVILEISDGLIMFVGVLECPPMREALDQAFPV